MFSPRHILYLSLAAAACAALTVLLRKKSLSFWINLLLGVGIVSETVKVFSYIIANEETLGGYLPKTEVDGVFGKITLGAVLAFQLESGLEPDGICGPLTNAALFG